jgi:predicted acyltransferase
MFLMMAEVLHLCDVASKYPGNAVWAVLCHEQSHVQWVGCSLHDMIQPSFSFLVGVAMVFSLSRRAASGQSLAVRTAHVVWRSAVLVFLGIFLRSLGSSHDRTNYTFEDTLTQIGLGYPFLYAIALLPRKGQWLALALLVVGYWAVFALDPLPDAGFDYGAVGVPAGWLQKHGLTGFAAHWQKNSNLAWKADRWFLNLPMFHRRERFEFNAGGYATLSFIPTLATMVLGLLAGGWLRSGRSQPRKSLGLLIAAGLACLGSGWLAGALGICPVVKRIWTPSWVLFSGGWCLLILAAFHAIVDLPGWSAWSYPLRVIGRNSIAAYLMAHLFEGFVLDNLRKHLSPEAFHVLGETLTPLLEGAAVLVVFWLILLWMDRRKIYLKI